MALQNIGESHRDDAFYRYKMPKLITKFEGRGNGIKTNLVNMVDVAKALGRSPAYTTKYFGCELGAQSRFDEKTGTAVVNGAHDTAKLAMLLENFIRKYVQCYGCGNPETEIVISKTHLISLKCAACGFISDVDMRDKLTTFILKNPPGQKREKKGMRRTEKERLKEGDALDEEMKKGKREPKAKKGHDGNGHVSRKKVYDCDMEEPSPQSSQTGDTDEDAEEDEIQWQTDTSANAVQERMKEQLTTATSELVMLETVKSDEQNSDVSLRRPTQLVSSANECSEIYVSLVEEFKKCLAEGVSEKQLAERVQSVKCEISGQETMKAYFEALFQGTSKDLVREIDKKQLYLSEFGTDVHAQALLLGAIEAFCSSRPLELQKEMSLVLKKLYDLDILEERAIISWYDNALNSSQMKRYARPIVEWFQNAESESEDEP